MKHTILLIVAIVCMAMSGINSEAQNLKLENDLLVAEFNPATGALVGYTNKQTGWNAVKRQALGQSFQMLIPLPDRRYNNAYGTKQKAPKVKQERNVITFVWDGIVSDHLTTPLPVKFTGTITLNESGLVYSGSVDNRSAYEVEYICWPYFGEVSIPDKDDNLWWQSINYSQSMQSEMYPYFSNHKGYYGVDYPLQMNTLPENAFLLIRNSKEGFSVITDDHTGKQLVQCLFELIPGSTSGGIWGGMVPKVDEIDGQPVRIEFKTNHIIYNQPKTKTDLTAVMLKPFQGTWHKGADHYKAWRSTWFTRPAAPEWLKKVHSWCQIQINSSEDYLNFRYSDLVDYAKECKQYGVSVIQLTGWNDGGQDRNNPTHDTDPRLGTWEELRDAIAECEEMGVRIVLFNKYTWADISNDWYRNDLKQYAALDPYGDPYIYSGYQYHTYTQLLGLNTRRFAVMCHLDDDWRKIADKEFVKSIDLGASGMLYDENQHHGGVNICYATNHSHKGPAYIFGGDDLLGKGFTDIYKKRNPDYIMFGEGIYDMQAQYYHGSYFRAGVGSIPMHRYIDPEIALCIAVSGHDGRNELNSCLKNKYIISYEPRYFKGKLSEAPKVMEYGQKIDALREQYKDFLWDGIYRDVLGATATGNYIIHSVFERKSDGKRAVVVLNTSETESSTATVVLEGGGKLKYVTPDSTTLQDFSGSLEMPSQSVAVFFEQ